MTTNDCEHIVRRLWLAEQEIARAHVEIALVRRECLRLGRTRLLATAAVVVVAMAMGSLMSSATAEAQAGGQVVRAPFTVVDAMNKPIFAVFNDAHRGVSLVRSDGRAFAQMWDEGASIRGPLVVTDNAEKAIVAIQDATVTKVKDAKGKEEEVASNRGLHLFNTKGDTVARMALTGDDGYVSARKAGQGAGVGGVQAAIFSNDKGSALTLYDLTKKQTVGLSSGAEGLTFFNDAGTAVAEVTRSRFWLGNKAGAGVVEAGMLPDGRGVVRAGPNMGGSIGGLAIPFAIMGHK